MAKPYKFVTSPERSELMSKIKSANTSPEIKIRKYLWKLGYRYSLNNKKLIGKPDIVLPKHKIIIFVDGSFWHGYKWYLKKDRIKANRDYWIPKIERNMKRDKKNSKLLKKEGWKVLRLWDFQIKDNFEKCISKIENAIYS